MVNDKRANRGDIKVNHILVRVMNKDESSDTEARKKIDEIMANINSGKETFENMARTYRGLQQPIQWWCDGLHQRYAVCGRRRPSILG